jgi:hypothetical protein
MVADCIRWNKEEAMKPSLLKIVTTELADWKFGYAEITTSKALELSRPEAAKIIRLVRSSKGGKR